MMHQFVVMWDCYGLESVIDVTQAEMDQTWETLIKGEKAKIKMPNILHLRLRAQANPQRHYEIYMFDAHEGIDADDIRHMFETNPQRAADTIRGIGHCFYSDRETKKAVIT
jgi:hypothetical protein